MLLLVYVNRQFVEACFGPFSAKLSVMGPYYVLKREVDDLITCLREKVDKRRRELSLGLPPATLHRVRMSHQELRVRQLLPLLFF